MTILISTETKPPQESDEVYNLKTPTQTKPLSYPFLYVITRTLLHTHTHMAHTRTFSLNIVSNSIYARAVYCQFILKNFVFFTPFFFPIHSFSFPFVFFSFSFFFPFFFSFCFVPFSSSFPLFPFLQLENLPK